MATEHPKLPKTRAFRAMNDWCHERSVSKRKSAIATFCRRSVDQATFWTLHRSLVAQRFAAQPRPPHAKE